MLRTIERDIPIANSGEVVVKVVASPVNPTDIMMRDGRQAALMTELKPPFIAGVEFAGHVHSAGSGSSGLAVGQPVMGIVNARRPAGGAHAQFICVPAASLAALAPTVDLVEAATVPMNALTAKMAIETLELPRGSSLLVTGGPGAAGGYVIQLAKEAGLAVVADAKDSDTELLRRLGADHIVPRGEAMAKAVRALYPDGVDGLVDAALLGDRAAAAVRDGGTAVTLRRSHPITDPRLRARGVRFSLRTPTHRPRLACRTAPQRQADTAHRHAAADVRGRRGTPDRCARRPARARCSDIRVESAFGPARCRTRLF